MLGDAAGLLAPASSAEVDTRLRHAVARIRTTNPGLVAKQVHALLLAENDGEWATSTVSEVKRICSKLAKAEVEESAGTHLTPAYDVAGHASSSFDVARVLMSPKARDVNEFKMARPGLPTNGTTLQRGDRLGTAAPS